MTKAEVKKRIVEIGIVPVVRASSAKEAMMAAEAVSEGGIPVVEVTMTVPGAVDVIAELTRIAGNELLVGAGTVLDVETARKCLDAGAQFFVSPGFDAETVAFANALGTVIMPGALTPTEVIRAWKGGADFVKIFPCGNLGGAKYIKALRGPLPQVPMIPTGGVNLNTAADFIRAGCQAIGIGGELVSAKALKAGDKASITSLARQYVELVREARETETIAVAMR